MNLDPVILEALEECDEYFADREDADHDGERYIPNPEMRLRMIVREAIVKAGGDL